MPKLAKSVQMSRKVLKCVANVWQCRELAGYLSMVYTVYKGVGCGMGAVEADLHDIAQGITVDIMRYRSIPLKCPHFEDG